MREFGTFIKNARIRRGFRTKQLAYILGETKTFIENIESGKDIPTDGYMLKRLCKALDIKYTEALKCLGMMEGDIMINHTIKESVKEIIRELEPTEYGREGLVETPKRVAKAYGHIFGGYKEDPRDILSTEFVEGACGEMVVLKGIEFYSMCEHHMLPFFGKVDIGYIPNGKVVGVSKLARLVDCFSRRLQIQEKLSSQIADSIMEILDAEGVIVRIQAEHLCMKMRGVEKRESVMVTTAHRGLLETDRNIRDEFYQMIKG